MDFLRGMRQVVIMSAMDAHDITISAMSGRELDETLDLLGWSGRYLARETQHSEGMVRRWMRDEYAVPRPIAAWLRDCAAIRRAQPPYPPPPDREG